MGSTFAARLAGIRQAALVVNVIPRRRFACGNLRVK
jgi:hypothetical protein